jgi:hypothetical protein
MLPDQINNLFNVQFFLTIIMWLSLLIALVRRQERKSRRALAVTLWLVATVIACPISETRINGLYNMLVYDGIQRALDAQCGPRYIQAEAGTYQSMSSYHWRWSAQRSNHSVVCDYEPGYPSWKCVC